MECRRRIGCRYVYLIDEISTQTVINYFYTWLGFDEVLKWNFFLFVNELGWACVNEETFNGEINQNRKLRRLQISIFQPPKQFKDPRLRFHWVHDPMTFDLPAGFLHPTQDIKCGETYFTVLVKLASASPLSQQTRQN